MAIVYPPDEKENRLCHEWTPGPPLIGTIRHLASDLNLSQDRPQSLSSVDAKTRFTSTGVPFDLGVRP